MMYITAVENWPVALIPAIALEVGFAWWMYLTGFQTHMMRAFILAIMMAFNIFNYGIQGENYFVLIPTLCTYAMLISLYELRPILDITILNIVGLFLYHVFIKQTFLWSEDKLERERMLLQAMSFIVFLILLGYRINRHKEEEQDIRNLEDEVERVQKIKDDFVANTSHELRTPINTISGMSEILLQEDLPENVHHEVLDIQMTGIELQTIVTDILDYAALESGTLTLNPRAYNITSTLNDVMNMTVFQNREKNLELIFDCDPGIPCSLYGDEQQLRRVINNLIGNAIKFTSEGGVRVSVTCRPEEYGVNLIVSVKDTGIGLTMEEQERIFQGFYQADADRNRNNEGMGLGLTISSSIIRKMGGFMNVKSQAGKGSEFTFSIPQKVLDERPCIALTHPEQIEVIWYYNDEEARSSIRDDYIDHIKHISDYLGIYMHRSSSLSELKRRIRQGNFSHLILGREEYREDPLYFDELAIEMPIIMIADREETLPAGNNMHILYKPYNAMTLCEIFNGGELLRNPRKYQEDHRFIAPEAKILVVDDNLMNLKVVEGLLRKYKIRITAASSGEEALSIIESKDFDFVFMDHMMPGMDGIECLHRIRSKIGKYFNEVPIIALTANAIAGSREMFLQEGFDDFVAKPIDNAILDQVLKKYIPQKKQIYDIPAEEEKEEKRPASEGNGFQPMEGIDMETALMYCGGDLNDYIELAKVYIETGEHYYEELIRFHAEQDWKNYAILAHSIKSTSKTLGAMKLSDIAYKEEQAAKAEDAITINQYHLSFLREYRRILDVMENNPGIARNEQDTTKGELSVMSEEEWKVVLSDLRKKIESYESNAVEDYIEKYKDTSLRDRPFGEVLKPVSEHIADLDFDGALSELEKIGGEMA